MIPERKQKNRRCCLCGFLQPEKQLISYRVTSYHGDFSGRRRGSTSPREMHCRDLEACRARRTCVGCGDISQSNSVTWDAYMEVPARRANPLLDRPLCSTCREVFRKSEELMQACSVTLDRLLERDAFKEAREYRQKRLAKLNPKDASKRLPQKRRADPRPTAGI